MLQQKKRKTLEEESCVWCLHDILRLRSFAKLIATVNLNNKYKVVLWAHNEFYIKIQENYLIDNSFKLMIEIYNQKFFPFLFLLPDFIQLYVLWILLFTQLSQSTKNIFLFRFYFVCQQNMEYVMQHSY